MTDQLTDLTIPDYRSTDWIKSLANYRDWNERAMWALLGIFGRPDGLLDLGCGDGWMLYTARRAGIKPTFGVELGDVARELAPHGVVVLCRDLTKQFSVSGYFGLTLCIEVAEHLDPSGTNQFINNLVSHTSNRLVFTAAPPGQNGDGHINCRDKEFWITELQSRGLVLNTQETQLVKQAWEIAAGPLFWLPANVLVFERAGVVRQ